MALSKIMRFALKQGLITSNPMDAINKPQLRVGGKARFLSATEVEKLALAFNDDVFATLVRFAAWTGLRAGELTALRVSDINLPRGVVTVTKTVHRRAGDCEVTSPKSLRSDREVPLAPHVSAWLRAYLATRLDSRRDGAQPLWPGRTKGGATPGAVDWTKPHEHGTFYAHHWRPAVAACGLAPLRFHDLRHTFASLCAEAGVPMYKASRWMGHANVSITDAIYAHLYTDHAADLARLSRLAGSE
jgi:integrase